MQNDSDGPAPKRPRLDAPDDLLVPHPLPPSTIGAPASTSTSDVSYGSLPLQITSQMAWQSSTTHRPPVNTGMSRGLDLSYSYPLRAPLEPPSHPPDQPVSKHTLSMSLPEPIGQPLGHFPEGYQRLSFGSSIAQQRGTITPQQPIPIPNSVLIPIPVPNPDPNFGPGMVVNDQYSSRVQSRPIQPSQPSQPHTCHPPQLSLGQSRPPQPSHEDQDPLAEGSRPTPSSGPIPISIPLHNSTEGSRLIRSLPQGPSEPQPRPQPLPQQQHSSVDEAQMQVRHLAQVHQEKAQLEVSKRQKHHQQLALQYQKAHQRQLEEKRRLRAPEISGPLIKNAPPEGLGGLVRAGKGPTWQISKPLIKNAPPEAAAATATAGVNERESSLAAREILCPKAGPMQQEERPALARPGSDPQGFKGYEMKGEEGIVSGQEAKESQSLPNPLHQPQPLPQPQPQPQPQLQPKGKVELLAVMSSAAVQGLGADGPVFLERYPAKPPFSALAPSKPPFSALAPAKPPFSALASTSHESQTYPSLPSIPPSMIQRPCLTLNPSEPPSIPLPTPNVSSSSHPSFQTLDPCEKPIGAILPAPPPAPIPSIAPLPALAPFPPPALSIPSITPPTFAPFPPPAPLPSRVISFPAALSAPAPPTAPPSVIPFVPSAPPAAPASIPFIPSSIPAGAAAALRAAGLTPLQRPDHIPSSRSQSNHNGPNVGVQGGGQTHVMIQIHDNGGPGVKSVPVSLSLLASTQPNLYHQIMSQINTAPLNQQQNQGAAMMQQQQGGQQPMMTQHHLNQPPQTLGSSRLSQVQALMTQQYPNPPQMRQQQPRLPIFPPNPPNPQQMATRPVQQYPAHEDHSFLPSTAMAQQSLPVYPQPQHPTPNTFASTSFPGSSAAYRNGFGATSSNPMGSSQWGVSHLASAGHREERRGSVDGTWGQGPASTRDQGPAASRGLYRPRGRSGGVGVRQVRQRHDFGRDFLDDGDLTYLDAPLPPAHKLQMTTQTPRRSSDAVGLGRGRGRGRRGRGRGGGRRGGGGTRDGGPPSSDLMGARLVGGGRGGVEGPKRRRPVSALEGPRGDDSEEWEVEGVTESYDPLFGLLLALRMGRRARRSKRELKMTTTPRLRRILKELGITGMSRVELESDEEESEESDSMEQRQLKRVRGGNASGHHLATLDPGGKSSRKKAHPQRAAT